MSISPVIVDLLDNYLNIDPAQEFAPIDDIIDSSGVLRANPVIPKWLTIENIILPILGVHQASYVTVIPELSLELGKLAQEAGLGFKVRVIMLLHGDVYRSFTHTSNYLGFKINEIQPETWDENLTRMHAFMPDQHRKYGNLFSYPDCCTDAFVNDMSAQKSPDRRIQKQFQHFGKKRQKISAFFARRFIPCRPNCEAAMDVGIKYSQALNNVNAELSQIYRQCREEHMADAKNGVLLAESGGTRFNQADSLNTTWR